MAGLPNLFSGTGHKLREKSYCGPHAFLQRFFTKKFRPFFSRIDGEDQKKGFRQKFMPFLAALMAKTNFRSFYLPENGKSFLKEINRAKRPRGPHKIASRAKCGPLATGLAAVLYGHENLVMADRVRLKNEVSTKNQRNCIINKMHIA